MCADLIMESVFKIHSSIHKKIFFSKTNYWLVGIPWGKQHAIIC